MQTLLLSPPKTVRARPAVNLAVLMTGAGTGFARQTGLQVCGKACESAVAPGGGAAQRSRHERRARCPRHGSGSGQNAVTPMA